MRFTFTVEIELNRTEGKFATRDEVGEQILEMIEGADPGSIDGVGPDSSSSYEVASWDVTEQEQPKRQRRRRRAGEVSEG